MFSQQGFVLFQEKWTGDPMQDRRFAVRITLLPGSAQLRFRLVVLPSGKVCNRKRVMPEQSRNTATN